MPEKLKYVAFIFNNATSMVDKDKCIPPVNIRNQSHFNGDQFLS